MYTEEDLRKRLLAKTRVAENGCHEWQGYTMKLQGYGQIGFNGKVLYTHRVAWLLAHSDPGDQHVLHECDNRRCVNPEHLFLGSIEDNIADMVAKGRQARGERNGHAKLTEEDVRAIRASSEPYRVLARRYGVCLATLSMVKTGKNWRHI